MFRHQGQEIITFWLKIPVLLVTKTAGDEPKVSLTTLGFVQTITAGDVPASRQVFLLRSP